MTRKLGGILAALLALSAPVSNAAPWPQEKPVVIISSNSAGSTPDVVARMAAEALSAAFKQQFLVENKPGGRSVVASMAAKNAAPDGYTLYMGGNTGMSANQFLVKDLPYDTQKDFDPICMVVDSAPLLLAVHSGVPAKTLDEFLALARKQPGKITYGVSGTLPPIQGDLLEMTAGVDLRQVRYKQTGLAVQDVVAHRVDMTLLGIPSLGGHIKEGTLRVLAVLSSERSPIMPQVPALEEKLPGISMEGWFILVAPKGIPKDIAPKVAAVLDPYLKKKETVERLHRLGLSTRGAQTPEATRDFIAGERARWAKIVKMLDLKPQ